MTGKSDRFTLSTMVTKETFSTAIKEYRLRKLWTQAQLAAVVGMTKSAINKLENGKSKPTALTLAKVHKALPDFSNAA